jgi:hypothetical protein
MSPLERAKFFQLRVTDDELAMLKRLAEADGVTASDVLRLFIRREHTSRFGELASKPKPKPKK